MCFSISALTAEQIGLGPAAQGNTLGTSFLAPEETSFAARTSSCPEEVPCGSLVAPGQPVGLARLLFCGLDALHETLASSFPT